MRHFRKGLVLMVVGLGLALPTSAQNNEELEAEPPEYPSPVACSEETSRSLPSPKCLKEEAFWSAQWAMQGGAAKALSNANARFASGSGALAELARSLEDARIALESAQSDHFGALAMPEGAVRDARVAVTGPALTEVQVDLKRIETELAARFPNYSELILPQPLAASETQDLLEATDALLMVLPGQTGTFAFLVTPDSLLWHRSDLSRAELAVMVEELRQSMGLDGASDAQRRVGGASFAFDRTGAHTLYTEVFGPLAQLIEDAEHFYFVTSGPLTAFPIGALVTRPPEGDDFDPQAMASTVWLQRQSAITVLPSPSSLKSLLAREQRKAKRAFLGVGNACTGWGVAGAPQPPVDICGTLDQSTQETLAMRDIVIGGTGRGVQLSAPTRTGGVNVLSPDDLRFSLSYLPNTRIELQALTETLGADPRNDLLIGRAASEARLREAGNRLADRRVIAFATHGLVATDGIENLDEPGLLMTPPKKGTPLDDGFLAASEIAADLKLNADFVILSACNTASPANSGADSLSGLAQAFFYAGARALLVSHWPVVDDIAPQITVSTVKAFEANPQIGRAKALKAALEPLMNSPATADPYYWAPFVLVGQNRCACANR